MASNGFSGLETLVTESTSDSNGGRSVLSRALSRARWSILWERLWPALATIATAAGLFLALSWLGLWLWLPPIGRAIGLLAFGVLALAAIAPLFFVRVPSRSEERRVGKEWSSRWSPGQQRTTK